MPDAAVPSGGGVDAADAAVVAGASVDPAAVVVGPLDSVSGAGALPSMKWI